MLRQCPGTMAHCSVSRTTHFSTRHAIHAVSAAHADSGSFRDVPDRRPSKGGDRGRVEHGSTHAVCPRRVGDGQWMRGRPQPRLCPLLDGNDTSRRRLAQQGRCPELCCARSRSRCTRSAAGACCPSSRFTTRSTNGTRLITPASSPDDARLRTLMSSV